jgi:hypothetical protein
MPRIGGGTREVMTKSALNVKQIPVLRSFVGYTDSPPSAAPLVSASAFFCAFCSRIFSR